MKKTFDPGELMLEKGRIYHLGLVPEEISDVIISVGDPNRVSRISHHFEIIELKKQHREFVTHTGYLNKHRLSVISTGIGVDNMEIFMNEVDALVNIDFQKRQIKPNHTSLCIIRLGTSGCLDSEIPLGSFIISDYAIGMDTLPDFYCFPLSSEEKKIKMHLIKHLAKVGEILRPYVIKGCPQLINALKEGCFGGITATTPGFFAAQGRLLRVQPTIPNLLELLQHFAYQHEKILNFEMETSSLYALGNALGHHCASISVAITQRIQGEMSKHPTADVENLISVMLPKITHLPTSLSHIPHRTHCK